MPQFIDDTGQKLPVLLNIMQGKPDHLLRIRRQLITVHHRQQILFQHPAQQRIDILKVIIESLAVKPAVLHNLRHSNL